MLLLACGAAPAPAPAPAPATAPTTAPAAVAAPPPGAPAITSSSDAVLARYDLRNSSLMVGFALKSDMSLLRSDEYILCGAGCSNIAFTSADTVVWSFHRCESCGAGDIVYSCVPAAVDGAMWRSALGRGGGTERGGAWGA